MQATAQGVGVSAPMRVELRGDREIELTIAAGSLLTIRLHDEGGAPIDGAEVVLDPVILEYPTLYGPEAENVRGRILGSYRQQKVKTVDGRVAVARLPQQPFAFAVRHPSFLPDHRVLQAGEAPAELTLVLVRAGSVRGGFDGSCARTVELRLAADDAAMQRPVAEGADRSRSVAVAVDAEGRFAASGLQPGAWRAAVALQNVAELGKRADECVGAVPVIDGGPDLRTAVDFAVEGGVEAQLELEAPRLGTLRGRVLLRGRPSSETFVYGTRPGWCVFSFCESKEAAVDWDNDLHRGWAPGQQVASDGSFAFHYREAGPIELRLRHARGHATQGPVVVQLPPPGDDVHCTIDLAAGAVRGRFLLERLPEKQRRFVRAVLYPLHKAQGDPSCSTDWMPAISWHCAHVDLQGEGRFAFDFLSTGDWLLRVQAHAMGIDEGPLWQRVVTVGADDVVVLGDLEPAQKVAATLRWRWPDTQFRAVHGVYLRRAHGADPAAIWVGTFAAQEGAVTVRAPAGHYAVVPFGDWHDYRALGYISGGWNSWPLAEPCAVELRADGSAEPAELPLRPLPEPESPR